MCIMKRDLRTQLILSYPIVIFSAKTKLKPLLRMTQAENTLKTKTIFSCPSDSHLGFNLSYITHKEKLPQLFHCKSVNVQALLGEEDPDKVIDPDFGVS